MSKAVTRQSFAGGHRPMDRGRVRWWWGRTVHTRPRGVLVSPHHLCL